MPERRTDSNEESDFRSAVSRRYNETGAIWDPRDRWHEVVKAEISRAISRLKLRYRRDWRLLVDVGSGGLVYDVPCRDYVQVDIAETRLTGLPLAICADAHHLPFGDGVADCVLCVGSVANYCDAVQLVAELARIASPGSVMVLHVELTNSLEFLLRPNFRAGRALVTTHYQGRPERTWAYSLGFIERQLDVSGFSVLDRRCFHTASAMAYRLGLSATLASYLSVLDPIIGLVPGAATLADSMILICEQRGRP